MRKLILLLCTALAITAASAQVKRTAKEQKIIDQAIKANTVGNFDEAITLYKKYLKKKPADSEIICYMGNSYYNKKEYETALECYKKAIEKKPDNANAHYNMGKCYTQLNDIGNAIDAYEDAVKFNKSYSSAYYNLGNIFRRMYNYRKAIEY